EKTRDDRRVHPHEQHGCVRNGREAIAAALGVIEQQREEKPEYELADDGGPDDEYEGVEHDRREVGVAEKALIVLETDEARARRVEPDESLVGEARVERPDRGSDEEKREEDRGRGQARQIRTVAPERGGGDRGGGADR